MANRVFRFGLIFLTAVIGVSSAAMAGIKADYVVIDKSSERVYLLFRGNIIRSFPAVFGFNPVGHKQYEGDGRTPEGRYMLDFKNDSSKFYRSIRVSYPNKQDEFRAEMRGDSPGGDIFIHGQKNGYSWEELTKDRKNWTDGCVAMRDTDMAQVWELVDVDTPIWIRP